MADFESILVVSFRVVARSILQNKVSAQEVWDYNKLLISDIVSSFFKNFEFECFHDRM